MLIISQENMLSLAIQHRDSVLLPLHGGFNVFSLYNSQISFLTFNTYQYLLFFFRSHESVFMRLRPSGRARQDSIQVSRETMAAVEANVQSCNAS